MAKSAAIESVGEGKLGTLKAWPQRAKSFYNDVRTEMRKVTTPVAQGSAGHDDGSHHHRVSVRSLFLVGGHDHRQEP
jgi:hypothetical protein